MLQRKAPKYLDWIRARECCFHRERRAEPHHLKGDFHASGVALTAPDLLSMPLCRPCHNAIQDHLVTTWKEDQREALLETLVAAIMDGELVHRTQDVDAKTCSWRSISLAGEWGTCCGTKHFSYRPDFCPWCGGKIEVRDE